MTIKGIRYTVIALLPLLTSCNLLTPLVFVGEHKKKVLPEFDKLANSRVAVLVWTDPATLFDYPHARFELATYVGEKLTVEMAQRQLGTEVVDSRDVEDYIQRDIDAQVDPLAVGRNFDTDYVLFIEVFEFQIRNPDVPQFLEAKIQASVSVHNIREEGDGLSRWELTPVKSVFPEEGPAPLTARNAPLVRRSVYQMFAEQVARKFYAHTVEL